MTNAIATPRTMPIWAVASGGIVTALAFPMQPVPGAPSICFWPLVFIGPMPYLARLMNCATARQAASTSLVYAFSWFVVAGVWVFRVFDTLGWVLIWIPIIWVVVFGLIARRLSWWTWPLAWLAVEFIRSEWTPLRLDWFSTTLDPLNFTWFGLGHPRLAWAPAAQSADLIGGYGLCLSPFIVSLTLARMWTRGSHFALHMVVVTCVLAADAGYCTWRWFDRPDGARVPVGVVQSERYDPDVLFDLTTQLLREHPATRLVVWPEESFTAKVDARAMVQSYAAAMNVTLAIGVEEILDEGGYRNRAWWVPPVGEIAVYAKQQRVPFVEHHPRSEVCQSFPLRLGDKTIPVGMLICYDMDFPGNPRRTVCECGVEMIVMPTLDDLTWGGTQHAQHSLMPRLRAIENRRSVVQAATSGVSQIIDDRGDDLAEIPFRIHARPDRTPMYREGFAAAEVPVRSDLSLNCRGGYWVPRGIAMLVIMAVAVSWVRKPRTP